MRRSLVPALAAVALLVFVSGARAGTGSFESSDPLLNRVWAGAVKTAQQMLAPGGQQFDALGRYCPTAAGHTVILDGVVRDRCPYVGDESVIDLTFDASDPHWSVQRYMLSTFAAGQKSNGAIPGSPLSGGTVLFDYCGYWAITLHDYVLYSGDIAFGRRMWPALVKLLDRWYPSETNGAGLLDSRGYPHADYAFIHRHGTVVAYYNAEYVYVLRLSAQLAKWLGHPTYEAKWLARAKAVSRAFGVFWDPTNGAFLDTTTDHVTHPQDGNAFAVISGIATSVQAHSALDYLFAHDYTTYGNTLVDVPTWDDPTWGIGWNQRVYPFMGFYELLARFQTGRDGSALDLIRREWGYMMDNGPGGDTDWEFIGPYGGPPTDLQLGGSYSAGWSSGAAPALTQYVLGVRPTSPGYATYTIDPHPGGLAWAKGDVVTPRGVIHVAWTNTPDGKPVVTSSLTPDG